MSTVVATGVCHIVKGETVKGDALSYGSGAGAFTTPALNLNALVWQRNEPVPALDVPVAEIVDLLVALGDAVEADRSGFLREACVLMERTSPLDPGVTRRSYEDLRHIFTRDRIEAILTGQIGNSALLDGWVDVSTTHGKAARIRAFPPRMVHILAGNVPGVAAISVINGALSKGVHLFKLPSNDLHSATALLRILSEIAPDHPVTRSFSAVYWRGGDAEIESRLFSAAFFDKLAAWGGESSLRSAKNYIGPGFELISFDPKTSISMIGREAFDAGVDLEAVADLAAQDATPWNQTACVSSRFQYIEATPEQADRFGEILARRMAVERRITSICGPRVSSALREEIEVLGEMGPDFGVFGSFDGKGLVVRSDAPVDFYPDGKLVNLVTVSSLEEAVRHCTVATQTVGVWPPERKAGLRDALASAGAQRIVTLGTAAEGSAGLPHDGFIPLHRFMRWINDED